MRGSGVPGGSVAFGLVASGKRSASGIEAREHAADLVVRALGERRAGRAARALSAPTVAGADRLRRRAPQPGQVRNPSESGLAVIEL